MSAVGFDQYCGSSYTCGATKHLHNFQAGQAGVAMLGLNYSFTPSSDPSSPALIEVNVSDMSRFYFGNEDNYTLADQLAAHTVGKFQRLEQKNRAK